MYKGIHAFLFKLILVLLAFVAFRPFFTLIPIIALLEGLVLLLVVMTSFRILCNKAIFFFLLYYSIVFIDLFIFDHPLEQENLFVLFTFSMELIFLFIVYYFVERGLNGWVKAAKLIMFFVVLSAIITFLFNLKQPGFYRNVELMRDEFRMTYEIWGVFSYYMFHAIALLFPFLILVYKLDNNKRYKIGSIVLLLLFTYLMFSSTITTAVGLGGISAIMAFSVNTGQKQIKLVIALLFIILFGRDLALIIIENLMPYADGTGMYQKLNAMHIGLLTGNEAAMTNGRSNLYNESWNAFNSNPFWGSHNATLLGGHSLIADRLGFYGILGFLPYIIFLIFQLKMPLAYIAKPIRPYYYLSYLPYIGMMYLKNIHLYEMYCMVFIVIPGLYIWASARYFPIRKSLASVQMPPIANLDES